MVAITLHDLIAEGTDLTHVGSPYWQVKAILRIRLRTTWQVEILSFEKAIAQFVSGKHHACQAALIGEVCPVLVP